MKIMPHSKAHLWGRQIAGLLIITGLTFLCGAALFIAARLEQRGVDKGVAFAGGLLAGLLVLGGVVVVLFAILYIIERRTRFRCGDEVRICMGIHQGATGVVLEPPTCGSKARIELHLKGEVEIVDVDGWQIKKIKDKGFRS